MNGNYNGGKEMSRRDSGDREEENCGRFV